MANNDAFDKAKDAGEDLMDRAKDFGNEVQARASEIGDNLRKRADRLFYRDEQAQEGDVEVKQGFVERLEVAGDNLSDKAQQLLRESNTRRLIIRSQEGKELLEVPLTGGIIAGGVLAFASPILTALTALGGAMAKVRLEVIRDVHDVEQLEQASTSSDIDPPKGHA